MLVLPYFPPKTFLFTDFHHVLESVSFQVPLELFFITSSLVFTLSLVVPDILLPPSVNESEEET